tara:strand:- start:2630 stop:2956 length:327 start_codon:yes stop_codon:yes gene_type:complete
MMTKEKVKIVHKLFIPWILEDYDLNAVTEAWGMGISVEEFAMNIAGLIPVQHITNWDDIKHHWDKDIDTPCDELDQTKKLYNKWSDYYEDDGYVEHIPDTLEIEWVKG